MEEMKLEVDCYSGRTADERPVRFRLEDCQYMVEEVLDQWYGPQDAFYKVRADDGNLYILRRETSTPDGALASGVVPAIAPRELSLEVDRLDQLELKGERAPITLPVRHVAPRLV